MTDSYLLTQQGNTERHYAITTRQTSRYPSTTTHSQLDRSYHQNRYESTYSHGLGLDVKGIFKSSGSTDSVIALRDAWERGEAINFTVENTPLYDVCDLVKMFLRKIPDCLLTSDLYETFNAVYSTNTFQSFRMFYEK